MDSSRYDPIRTMSKLTDEVIVAFSGGKESIVVLDMCMRHFKRVVPFFMYYIPGMSFQERQLKWYEEKYGIEIVRLPHFELSNLLRYGTLRNEDLSVPIISINDIYEWMRNKYGIYWIAAGERSGDSLIRGAMIKKSGSIDYERGKIGSGSEDLSDRYLEELAVLRKTADNLTDYDTFLMHGAAIAVEHKAYLFTGKSGTGTDHGRDRRSPEWKRIFGGE